jgi:hypothetical protein
VKRVHGYEPAGLHFGGTIAGGSAVGLSCAPFVSRWSLASPTALAWHGVEPRCVSPPCHPTPWLSLLMSVKPRPRAGARQPSLRPPAYRRATSARFRSLDPSLPHQVWQRRRLVPCRAGARAVGGGARGFVSGRSLRFLPPPSPDSGAAAGIPPRPSFRPPPKEPRLRRVLFICFRSDRCVRKPAAVTCYSYPPDIIAPRAREMPQGGFLD